MTIGKLKQLNESEHKVEFKEARYNFPWNGGGHKEQKERRKCFLGYVVALANEGGGRLVLGMADKPPHDVKGTDFGKDKVGALEDETYNRLGIRVRMEELYENGLRVLVVHIPGRPVGKMLKFEGVPLMRVGESLRNMNDEEIFAILSEQEPDFSAKFCEGINVNDLDKDAIQKMKAAYAEKQSNPLFLTQTDEQCLTDFHLLVNGKLTFAALILLGEESVIKKFLPQSAVFLEYRNDPGQINFDDRYFFHEPYFLAIDKIWETINLRNGKVPVQQGPYIFDIPFFNKEVIREAVNNAIAHRDYRRSSEVVIKEFPQAMNIISPGGFPIGVTLKNLLTVSSTPRNRLLTEILAKTGIVERSGQGVDKIFFQSIAEAKGVPDYTASDDFQVELHLSAIVKDKAFALFIKQLQRDRKNAERLSVKEIVTLDAIREGKSKDELDKFAVDKLLAEGLIEKIGKTSNQKLGLSKAYYSFTNKEADYIKNTPIDESYMLMKINQHLHVWKKAKMGKFVDLFRGQLSRDQVKNFIYKLSDPGKAYLEFSGNGPAREYFLGSVSLNRGKLIQKALEIGLEQLRSTGELNTDEQHRKTQDLHKNPQDKTGKST